MFNLFKDLETDCFEGKSENSFLNTRPTRSSTLEISILIGIKKAALKKLPLNLIFY